MDITYAQRRNLLSGLRRRAKKENIEVSISLWDIEIPDFCPELKIKIEIKSIYPPNHPNRPFIDRINLKENYTKENLLITSQKAANERVMAIGECSFCKKKLKLTRQHIRRETNNFCNIQCNRNFYNQGRSLGEKNTIRYALEQIPTQLISRQEAFESAPPKPFYFTGNPCKRGHISARRTNNGICLACEELLRDKKTEEQNLRYEKNRVSMNKRRNQSLRDNPERRIIANLRSSRATLLAKIIKSGPNSINKGQTIDDLGCTPEQFINHLVSSFKEGMTLENYGDWHLDHIKPLSMFENPLCPEAWNYKNLQPLWADENIKKGGSNNPHTKSIWENK